MANTGSQALAIRDLLVERLELYDPSLDTGEGSPLFNQVIEPIFEALGTDPFDTDIETFLKDRIRQEFPTISATDGDAIVDLLIRPLQLLQETFKRELEIVRRGQSTQNADTMRLEDAVGLASNFFVDLREGGRSTGTVRVFFAAPTFVSVLSTVSFSTPEGLRFFPLRPQFFAPETLLLQRSGTFFYVDVVVIAEQVGSQYDVEAGTISRVSGLASSSRVTNLSRFSQGGDSETAEELLNRTSNSLTERSLNTRRGIQARLFNEFPTLRNLEVVGYGDLEMNRDIITGGGEGSVVASGILFIVGQFAVMFSQFEDRGFDGRKRIQEGDEIELNYWKFLYDVDPEDANETFTITDILFDTRDIFEEQIPSILLFKLSGTPSAAPPIAATLPGVLPGVFAVVRGRGVIQISDIPGGILSPDTPQGIIEINDNEIHIGGHYDVWVRPSTDLETVTTPSVSRSESSTHEGDDLCTSGGSPRFPNQVHKRYEAEVSPLTGLLQLGEIVEGQDSGAVAKITKKVGDVLTLSEFGLKEFKVGEILIGRRGGGQATVLTIDAEDWENIEDGSLLSIVSGNDSGVYKVLKIDGPFMYLDVDLTVSEEEILFRVLSETTIDLFNPKEILVPFADNDADDLKTVIGSRTVRTSLDLLRFGAKIGDALEILEGDDKGVFSIEDFDESFGGKAPILSTQMSSTNSGVPFRVFRSGNPLQAPLVRVLPNGVKLLDPSGQDSGSFVPYALPVQARALEGFAGAGVSAKGMNGFVLADPGKDFEPEGDVAGDTDDFEDVEICFSNGCLPCDGFIAVVTLTDDGSFYLDSQLPAPAAAFLQDLRDWLNNVISTFDLGDDVQAFVDGFHPVILGPPDTLTTNILYQAEICLPPELFDGCNNVFVAIPEFDWQAEFQEGGIESDVGIVSFAEALDKFNSGELKGGSIPPALLQASPGDSLTVLTGPNAGPNVIDKVFKYKLCHGGAIQDDMGGPVFNIDACYDVVAVAIKGAFPVDPLSGLAKFFEDGVPDLEVPLPPALNVECIDITTGNEVSPWEVIETLLTWIFQWLDSMGYDLPDSVTLDPGETLKALWQLLFTEYMIGQPTCDQITRASFIEPTSMTAYSARACEGFTWAPPEGSPAEVEGSFFTMPMADLDGVLAALTIEDIVGTKNLSGTLNTIAATATTIAALAAEMQILIDPDQSFVQFSGPATATGQLKAETIQERRDVTISVTADALTDAFRAMGFHGQAGDQWAFMYHEEGYAENFRDVTLGTNGGFGIALDLGSGSVVLEAVATAGTYTWQTLLDALVIALGTSLASAGTVSASTVSGQLVETAAGRWALEFSLNISAGDIFNTGVAPVYQAPAGDTDYRALLGLTAVTQFTFDANNLEFRGNTEVAGIGDLYLEVDNGTADVCTKAWTDFAEYAASGIPEGIQDVIDSPAAVDRFDALAIALNADADIYSDGSTRRVWFVGGDRLEIRAVPGGVDTTLRVQVDGALLGYNFLEFDNGTALSDIAVVLAGDFLEVIGLNPQPNNEGQGDVVAGAPIDGFFEPRPPTLFSVIAGAEELLYVASENVPPYQIYPGQDTAGPIPPTRLPRDILVSDPYDDSLSTILRFSDGFEPAPLAAGLEEDSDWLWIYEQRKFLEHTIADGEVDLSKDRVIAVITSFGSNEILLPRMEEPDFDFMDSTTDDPLDEAKPGDVIFLEEGADAGGYLVIERTENRLTLSAAMTESSGQIFKLGNDGSIEADTAQLESEASLFDEDDIGRYLTIWATNRTDYDGSYRITAVEDFGTHTTATLDVANFPNVEQEIHWAVVKAPSEDPPASGTEGQTALVGVRPARIYNGDPSKWRVTDVSPHLARTSAEVLVAHLEEEVAPRQGVLQPYQFVRPGVQHISSTAMKGQGRELGLYWFDILTHSLGGGILHNIPQDTRMEPIFGTFESEGYRLEVEDTRLAFSSEEQVRMVSTPTFLPVGFADVLNNHLSVEGRGVRISYDFAPLVDQIQRLMVSDNDRVLCANPLTRHFLPSYVYLDINATGGNSPTKIGDELISLLDSLQPQDEIDVSVLEGVLHSNSVVRYDHPITVIIVTHDLDRRLVATRSSNKIGEDEVIFNGSNRTTFFIAGENRSGLDEVDIPDGERTYIQRQIPNTTL